MRWRHHQQLQQQGKQQKQQQPRGSALVSSDAYDPAPATGEHLKVLHRRQWNRFCSIFPTSNQSISSILKYALTFAAGCVVTWLVTSSSSNYDHGNESSLIPSSLLRLRNVVSSIRSSLGAGNSDPGGGKCGIYFGEYKGKQYRSEDTVGEAKCLVESKFIKVQQHQVRMKNSIIPDWIWIDYHERINVLVEAPKTTTTTTTTEKDTEGPHFLVFEQTKYALEGRMSLAIVGGIVEPGEAPELTASREVAEEMNMSCGQIHFLGRYRTDVNRGMGWTHTFVASDCTPITNPKEQERLLEDEKNGNQVGAADTERQDLKRLSLSQLRSALQDGKFLEIQWTATISLALLYLENR